MRTLNEIDLTGARPVGMEEVLVALGRQGEPMLTLSSYGWACWIDIQSEVAGAKIHVSASKQKNPGAAVMECARRVQAVFAKGGLPCER